MTSGDVTLRSLLEVQATHVRLGDVGVFTRGNGLQKKHFQNQGHPCIHYGQIFTHYGTSATTSLSFVDDELARRLKKAEPGELIIATTSENSDDLGKAVAWLGSEPVAVSGDAFIYSHDLDPRYVSYYFQSAHFRSRKRRHISGTKVKRISGVDLARIKIPVPPRETQEAIADILASLEQVAAELGTELQAELEARRRQYQFYRDSAFESVKAEAPTVAIERVCSRTSSGGTPSTNRDDFYGGSIPWLRTQEVDYGVVMTTGKSITEAGLRNSSAQWVPAGAIIVAMYGATAAKVAVAGIPLTTNQACCNLEIDTAKASVRYVYHWLVAQYETLRGLGEGSQSNLNASKVRAFPIPLPPLDLQHQLAASLDSLDVLVNELTSGLPAEIAARRKQYEYYRDRLLAFERA